MEKIVFDSGVREYKLNGMGILRFNPGDPNLYARFLEAADKIRLMEQTMVEQAKADSAKGDSGKIVQLMQEADRQMKDVLSWVFGAGNDFDKLLGGVNLLAMAGNGQRVVTNLFTALQPILISGIESYTRERTAVAVRQAKARRATQ